MATTATTSKVVRNPSAERRTSIAAHFVRSVSVTMSHSEMEDIINVLSIALEAEREQTTYISLTGSMRDAAQEMVNAYVELGE